MYCNCLNKAGASKSEITHEYEIDNPYHSKCVYFITFLDIIKSSLVTENEMLRCEKPLSCIYPLHCIVCFV